MAEFAGDDRRDARRRGRARDPGAVGHAGQQPPRGVSIVLDWVHLICRLDLARRADRPARPVRDAARAGARVGGAGGRRPALLERRARVGRSSCWSPGRGRRSSTCRRSSALWKTGCGRGDPDQDRDPHRRDGAWRRATCCARGRAIAAQGDDAPRAARTLRGSGRRRDGARRRRDLRRRDPHEPRAAAAVVRAAELGPGQGRPGRVVKTVHVRRLRPPGAGVAQQGRGARLVRAADHQGRQAGSGRRRHA